MRGGGVDPQEKGDTMTERRKKQQPQTGQERKSGVSLCHLRAAVLADRSVSLIVGTVGGLTTLLVAHNLFVSCSSRASAPCFCSGCAALYKEGFSSKLTNWGGGGGRFEAE